MRRPVLLVALLALAVPVAAESFTCASLTQTMELVAAADGGPAASRVAVALEGLSADGFLILVRHESPGAGAWHLEMRETYEHGTGEGSSGSVELGGGTACMGEWGSVLTSVEATLTSAGHTAARLELWLTTTSGG